MSRILELAILVVFGFLISNTTGHSVSLTGRIIGGVERSIKEIPFQLSLYNGSIHFCGAALLNEKWAITAAHCVDNSIKIQVRVNSDDCTKGGELIPVVNRIIHPDFDFQSFDHDVALLELQPFNSKGMKFARMQKCNPKPWEAGQILEVSGWGFNNIADPDERNLLRSVRVPLVTRARCNQLFRAVDMITDQMMCAGFVGEGGRDACEGDSGGPATLKGDLIGVVSAGQDCGHPEFPGVYTDLTVPTIKTWIQTTAGLRDPCKSKSF